MAEDKQQSTPEVTYEQSLSNKPLIDSMYYVLQDLGEKDIAYDPKTIMDTFLTKKRYFDTNLLSTINVGGDVEGMDEDGKKMFAYALSETDKLPNFYEKGGAPAGSAIADYIFAGVTDPTNLLAAVASAFTLGTGGAAALAGREAARQGVGQLLKAKLKAAVSKPVLKSLAVDGAISGTGGATQSYLMQDTEKEIGLRKEIDPYQVALQGVAEGTLSPAAGILGNMLGSLAVKTSKDLIENVPGAEYASEWLKRNFLPSAGIEEVPRRLTERRVGEINSLETRAFDLQNQFDAASKKELGDATTPENISLLNKALEGDVESFIQLRQVAPETSNLIRDFNLLKREATQYGIDSKLSEQAKGVFSNNANYVRNVPEAYYVFKRKPFKEFLADNPNVIQEYKTAIIENALLPAEQQYEGFKSAASKFINNEGQVTLPDSQVNKIITEEVKKLYKPTRMRRTEIGPLGERVEVPEVVKNIIGYNNKPALRISDTINGIVSTASRANLAGDLGADAVRRNVGVTADSLADANAISPTGREMVPLVGTFDKGLKKAEKSLSPIRLPAEYVDPALRKIYIDKQYAAQLSELFDDTPFLNSALADTAIGSAYRVILGTQNFAKIGKTIYSPIAHIRNALGAGGYTAISGNTRGLLDTVKALKGLTADELSNEWQEFTNLGLRGSNIDLNQALKRIQDVAGSSDEKTLMNKLFYLGKPGEITRKTYQATDDIAKFVVLQNEKRKSGKIFDAFSPEEQARLLDDFKRSYGLEGPVTRQDYINEQAAIKTGNITPIYDRIPPILEKMRVVPIIGSFTAYPAERLRNTYNILKLATDEMRQGFETGNKELTKAGIARLGQWYVGQGALYTAAYSLNEYLGNEEVVNNLRNTILPDYKKDNAIVVTKVDKDGNPYIVDFSYINPDQSVVGSIIPMMLKASRGEDVSKDIDQSILEAGKKLFEPFISPTLVVEAASNMLQVAQGDLSKLGPLSKIIEPGFVNFARKMVTDAGALDNVNSTLYKIDEFYNPRIYGEVPERATDLLDLFKKNALVFPGMKEEKIDLKKYTGYALRELAKNSRENWTDFRREVTSTLTDPTSVMNFTDIANRYNEALIEQYAFQQGLSKLYRDLVGLAGKERTRKILNSFDLGNAVPSKRDQATIYTGRSRPQTISTDNRYWIDVNKNLIEKTGNTYMPELRKLRSIFREIERYYVGKDLSENPPELEIKE